MTVREAIDYVSPYMKNMKRAFKFLIYRNVLITADEYDSIMYTMEIVDTGIVYANRLDYIKEFFTAEAEGTLTPITYDRYRKSDFRIYDGLLRLYSMYNSVPIDVTKVDLQEDEEFKQYIAMRAKSYMTNTIVEDFYYIPIFYGVFTINKGDKLNMYLSRLDEESSLVRYETYKKKYKANINTYFRIKNIL